MANSSSFWQEVNAVPGAILTDQGLLNQYMQLFKNAFYGTSRGSPSTRPDGTLCQTGDLYYDTALLQLMVYNGSAWASAATGTTTNSGTAQVNFGAYPGTDQASVFVSDLNVAANSGITVSIAYASTTDHSADEHMSEGIYAVVGNISPGVGFTIYAASDGLWPLLQGAFNISWIRR